MKKTIQHPVYGEIIYNENDLSGKVTLKVNGKEVQSLPKKQFLIDGKRATVKGNFLSGVKLTIDGQTTVLIPAPAWYEIAISVIPFIFLMIWGNSASLCMIFPVVGGALGGCLGGIAFVLSILFMKSAQTVSKKILIGVGVFAVTLVVSFILALILMAAML